MFESKDINILAIAPYRFLPAMNGGHKAIEQLYGNLSKLAKTIVISVQSNDEKLATNYILLKLFSNSFLHYINLFYFFKIKNLIREHNITHIIIEHPYMGWLGSLLKKYAGVTFITHAHNIEAMRFKTIGKWWWKIMWWYEKQVYKKSDIVCFITEEDKDFAMHKYQVQRSKCIITTYGTELNRRPDMEEKQVAKTSLQQQYQVSNRHKIILFNGSFSYQPNSDALQHLLHAINPLLITKYTDNYTIIICGIDIPQTILNTKFPNTIITGFVSNINDYFMAADIFVCPVISGGGIKTKLIEALAYDNTCISYSSSSIGITESECNGKLLIAEDNDAQQFADKIQQALETNTHIDSRFYNKYNAMSISEHLYKTLQNALP